MLLSQVARALGVAGFEREEAERILGDLFQVPTRPFVPVGVQGVTVRFHCDRHGIQQTVTTGIGQIYRFDLRCPCAEAFRDPKGHRECRLWIETAIP